MAKSKIPRGEKMNKRFFLWNFRGQNQYAKEKKRKFKNFISENLFLR